MLYVILAAIIQVSPIPRGQVPIVHLEADLHTVVKWADGRCVP